MPMLVYAATALAIVFTDLLTGVLVGFALTLLKLVLKAARLKIALRYTGEHEAELRLSGAATFLRCRRCRGCSTRSSRGPPCTYRWITSSYVDHACMELLEDWGRMAPVQGSRLVIEPRRSVAWKGACAAASGWAARAMAGRSAQAEFHPELLRQARPLLPGGDHPRVLQVLAVGAGRVGVEGGGVEHVLHRMVDGFVQPVGEGLADQLVGHQVGYGGVQWDQCLAEVGDVAVVHFFHQAVRQVGFVEQGVEAVVAGEQRRRGEEELLGDLQHRLDPFLDAGFAGHAVGGVEQVRYLFDVGVDGSG